MAFLRLHPTAVAAAIGTLFLSPLSAQSQSAAPGQPASSASLSDVVVSAKAAPVLDAGRADVGGWATPLSQTPQSITVLGADLLATNATGSLSQAIRLDASLSDSYNTVGYLENLSVRGFLLNNDGNTLRNGLAVSSYAPLALENKERIEVLKGVSGLQSGVSAPGGLVNLVTKAPVADPFTTVLFGTDDQGGSKAHLDTNARLGTVGVRVNLAQENLHPAVDSANGQRQFCKPGPGAAAGRRNPRVGRSGIPAQTPALGARAGLARHQRRRHRRRVAGAHPATAESEQPGLVAADGRHQHRGAVGSAAPHQQRVASASGLERAAHGDRRPHRISGWLWQRACLCLSRPVRQRRC